MNSLSYYILSGDSLPHGWHSDNPLVGLVIVDSDICRQVVGSLYILEKDVDWDVEPAELENSSVVIEDSSVSNSHNPDSRNISNVHNSIRCNLTPKEDLYIQPPSIPTFRYDKPWMSSYVNNEAFVIYTSLPEIPTKQNEISVTTDVDRLTDSDLLNLFPNTFIQTRSKMMYTQHDNIFYDDVLGSILNIDGFTQEEIRDNVIKYPHIFKLQKIVNDKVVSFYNTVEIDGQLHSVRDVWRELTKYPYNSDFVKEYVVRRYLLERDIKHIVHKYPLYGSLDPYLTLFTTSKQYKDLGYQDPIDIARKCVVSRVKYKQSRNPMIRQAMKSHE